MAETRATAPPRALTLATTLARAFLRRLRYDRPAQAIVGVNLTLLVALAGVWSLTAPAPPIASVAFARPSVAPPSVAFTPPSVAPPSVAFTPPSVASPVVVALAPSPPPTERLHQAAPTPEPPKSASAPKNAPENAEAHAAVMPPLAPPPIIKKGEHRPPRVYIRRMKARRGDSLGGMLARASSNKDAYAALAAMKNHHNPRHMRAGDIFHAVILNDGTRRPTLARFAASPSPAYDFAVWRQSNGDYQGARWAHALRDQEIAARGVIRSSLFRDAQTAGLPPPIIVELIRMFAHRIDFQREIRPGDSFEVLYRQRLNDKGQRVSAGPIVYAAMTTGKTRRAFWRHKPNQGLAGYYDAQGAPLASLLMRTPIDGARVSSHFGMRRHPVLGYSKLHAGVDFAAPTGTPVYAAGDGVIEIAARRGSYGKYIRMRHAQGFKTAYAHLNGYARGIKKGTKVQQGTVIGFVGSTGRSTGPHLHYETFKGAKRVNPMKVKLPEGKPLPASERDRFAQTRARIVARMQTLQSDHVVLAESAARQKTDAQR